MGFMDTVTTFTKGVGQKAKGGADMVALKAQIASVQHEVSGLYQQVGEKYYDMYKDSPEQELERLISTISERLDKLKELQAQMEATKEATAAVSLTNGGEPAYQPNATKTCPSCGASMSENAIFCRSCGAKYKETVIDSTASECDSADEVPASESPETEENFKDAYGDYKEVEE